MEKDYIKLEVKDVELNFAIRALLKRWKSHYDYEAQAWEAPYLYPVMAELNSTYPASKWGYSNGQHIYSL